MSLLARIFGLNGGTQTSSTSGSKASEASEPGEGVDTQAATAGGSEVTGDPKKGSAKSGGEGCSCGAGGCTCGR